MDLGNVIPDAMVKVAVHQICQASGFLLFHLSQR